MTDVGAARFLAARWSKLAMANYEVDPAILASLYGPEFAPYLAGTPASCFVADGSPIVVRRGVSLRAA